MYKFEITKKAYEILHETREKFPQYEKELSKVYFQVNNRLRAVSGRSTPATGQVQLSGPIFSDPENEYGLRNTVLHEIAHIISQEGHTVYWRSVFMQIGGNGHIVNE
jgi:hypothetical protein